MFSIISAFISRIYIHICNAYIGCLYKQHRQKTAYCLHIFSDFCLCSYALRSIKIVKQEFSAIFYFFHFSISSNSFLFHFHLFLICKYRHLFGVSHCFWQELEFCMEDGPQTPFTAVNFDPYFAVFRSERSPVSCTGET